ncbi:hypothetical protein MA20_12895 [Bradyrhizobium japonicum]|uniref:Uncharacterized protein n=1 Tax=Bradyrhizobium japonicum TaxID=375 RepID=A0A0A3XXX8_BRAJP|nr:MULTISPECIES: hypothetical protein [Bradyrhizobium]KGT79307.1 hypothetical protein MA20_12895 [Bradyrhizobium japonicum]MBR0945245.1 hypothetical protein [Bradyrhizobium liaoningense]
MTHSHRSAANGVADQLSIAEADREIMRQAMLEACDLLAERKYGSPARSPGHNARLVLERALATGIPAVPQKSPDLAAGMTKAMEIVGEMRMSEAGIFDEKHSGQRGEDRSNALYDAYVAIRSALPRPQSETPTIDSVPSCGQENDYRRAAKDEGRTDREALDRLAPVIDASKNESLAFGHFYSMRGWHVTWSDETTRKRDET